MLTGCFNIELIERDKIHEIASKICKKKENTTQLHTMNLKIHMENKERKKNRSKYRQKTKRLNG